MFNSDLGGVKWWRTNACAVVCVRFFSTCFATYGIFPMFHEFFIPLRMADIASSCHAILDGIVWHLETVNPAFEFATFFLAFHFFFRQQHLLGHFFGFGAVLGNRRGIFATDPDVEAVNIAPGLVVKASHVANSKAEVLEIADLVFVIQEGRCAVFFHSVDVGYFILLDMTGCYVGIPTGRHHVSSRNMHRLKEYDAAIFVHLNKGFTLLLVNVVRPGHLGQTICDTK